MQFKPGSRWRSAVCETEIIVVKPPKQDGALECGGVPVLAHAAARASGQSPAGNLAGGSLLGKRYGDDAAGLEVLCTKPGQGTLAFAGRILVLREAKQLPASD